MSEASADHAFCSYATRGEFGCPTKLCYKSNASQINPGNSTRNSLEKCNLRIEDSAIQCDAILFIARSKTLIPIEFELVLYLILEASHLVLKRTSPWIDLASQPGEEDGRC